MTAERKLRDALEDFETCLNTPVVSGELAMWANYLLEAWRKAADPIDYHINHVHRSQLHQISEDDRELANCVQALEAEANAIRELVTKLNADIERLAEKSEQVEQHENRAEQDLQETVAEGLALVARVRKQDVAIRTWLGEALNRERGTPGG